MCVSVCKRERERERRGCRLYKLGQYAWSSLKRATFTAIAAWLCCQYSRFNKLQVAFDCRERRYLKSKSNATHQKLKIGNLIGWVGSIGFSRKPNTRPNPVGFYLLRPNADQNFTRILLCLFRSIWIGQFWSGLGWVKQCPNLPQPKSHWSDCTKYIVGPFKIHNLYCRVTLNPVYPNRKVKCTYGLEPTLLFTRKSLAQSCKSLQYGHYILNFKAWHVVEGVIGWFVARKISKV